MMFLVRPIGVTQCYSGYSALFFLPLLLEVMFNLSLHNLLSHFCKMERGIEKSHKKRMHLLVDLQLFPPKNQCLMLLKLPTNTCFNLRFLEVPRIKAV